MSLRAGFAEIDITPPLGTRKIGWLKVLLAEIILDPIYARIAIFESAGEKISFVQLDTLSVRWTQTNQIRQRVSERYGFPADRVMVSATHNHAGPAVATCGDVKRDDLFMDSMVDKVVSCFGEALDSMRQARIGFGRGVDFHLGYNRRVVQRNGLVRSHGVFDTPEALCIEGPVDPEINVIAVRDNDEKMLGCLVNFACHPAHHGGEGEISAGYPGVLASIMKERGCPVTLFLNGASGNIATSNPATGDPGKTKEELGLQLADDLSAVMESMTFSDEVEISSTSKTIQLPYRNPSDEEIAGKIPGAQRFIDSNIYDRRIPEVLKRIRERGVQPAEVQVHFLDSFALVAIPAELFVELGLRMKEESYPKRVWVVSHANGMIGYVPTKDAFVRGGYETTFCDTSRMAPETGDMLADCAIGLVRNVKES